MSEEKLNVAKLIDDAYANKYKKPKCEWVEEDDKELTEDEAKAMNQLFSTFLEELEESGKSQFVAKLIGYGVLDKDEKTGKLVKGKTKMTKQEVIDKAAKA